MGNNIVEIIKAMLKLISHYLCSWFKYICIWWLFYIYMSCALCYKTSYYFFRPTGGSDKWTATACDCLSLYLTGAVATIILQVCIGISIEMYWLFHWRFYNSIYFLVDKITANWFFSELFWSYFKLKPVW